MLAFAAPLDAAWWPGCGFAGQVCPDDGVGSVHLPWPRASEDLWARISATVGSENAIPRSNAATTFSITRFASGENGSTTWPLITQVRSDNSARSSKSDQRFTRGGSTKAFPRTMRRFEELLSSVNCPFWALMGVAFISIILPGCGSMIEIIRNSELFVKRFSEFISGFPNILCVYL